VGVFGNPLREAREARGLSLEAAADATRIAPRHLAALERSDLGALPVGPFAKGFIEGYAQFLDIDPGPILEAYRHEGRRRGLDPAETRDRVIEELSRLVEQRERTARAGGLAAAWKRLTLGLLAVVVVGSLGYGGWVLTRGGVTRAAVAPSTTPAEEEAPPDEEAHETTPGEARAVAEGESTGSSGSRQVSTPGADPASAPPGGPEPTSPASTGEIEISHSGVGTGVESHELVGGGDRFAEGTWVVFWTRVLGGDAGDVVHHVWLHEGEVVTRAELALGSPSYRTHSRRLLEPGLTGRWVVEARRPDGTVLARHEFACIPEEGR
jgi:cytoskeleton protein RodZ